MLTTKIPKNKTTATSKASRTESQPVGIQQTSPVCMLTLFKEGLHFGDCEELYCRVVQGCVKEGNEHIWDRDCIFFNARPLQAVEEGITLDAKAQANFGLDPLHSWVVQFIHNELKFNKLQDWGL